MPTNDFLPFATGVGANVESQADWATEPSVVANGFSGGFARSSQANKSIRQPSFAVHVVSQYMTDVLAANVSDDGIVGNYYVQLYQALLVGGSFNDVGSVNAWLTANPFGLVFPAPLPGLQVRLKVANAVTNSTTFNWMGTGNKPVTHTDATPVNRGEVPAGAYVTLTYDGTHWQLPQAALSGIVILTANADFYIATGGNDFTGDGSAGNPWATLTKAYSYITGTILNFGGHTITIHVADGTYNAGLDASVPAFGGGVINISGNPASPGNVIINTVNEDCFLASNGANIYVEGMTLISTSPGGNGGTALAVTTGGNLSFNNIVFSTCAFAHMFCTFNGNMSIGGALPNQYTISGDAPNHINCSAGATVIQSPATNDCTITLSGTRAFSSAFVIVGDLGFVYAPRSVFSGSATGTRYSVSSNAVIDTSAHGSTYFPGSVAGATSTGGQYI